jgi:hypothetical protein
VGLLAVAAAIALVMSHAWGGVVVLLVPLIAMTLAAFALLPFDARPAIACLPLLATAGPLAWRYAVGDSTGPAGHGVVLVLALPLAASTLALAAVRETRRSPET